MEMLAEKETVIISDVAIYIRKSRGDGDEDLAKHKAELVDFATRNKWRYTIYAEIGSAATITNRPKMVELLEDIKNDMYDAVLVVDYDRLSRGDDIDAATITSTIRDTNTLIVTPQKMLDLNNDDDEFVSDMYGFIARMEYKQIKKRLRRGKVRGAKYNGAWVNGTPPFPYVYDGENKTIKVDEEKRPLYEHIKDSVLKGEALQNVAIRLNRQGYRTNKGKKWSATAIHRLVSNPVHLGHIVYGRTTGSGHKNAKGEYIGKPLQFVDRSKWIVVENAHEAVLTQEDYDTIHAVLNRNKLVKHRARKGSYILSGLIKCGKCGANMSFNRKSYGGVEYVFIKTCQKDLTGMGDKCGNSGIKEEYVLNLVKHFLAGREERLRQEVESKDSSEMQRLNALLIEQEKGLDKIRKGLDRIKVLFEDGDYTKEEYHERRDKRLADIKAAEAALEETRQAIGYYENRTKEEQLADVLRIGELWTTGTEKEINLALKKVISRITLRRDGDSIDIDIIPV